MDMSDKIKASLVKAVVLTECSKIFEMVSGFLKSKDGAMYANLSINVEIDGVRIVFIPKEEENPDESLNNLLKDLQIKRETDKDDQT